MKIYNFSSTFTLVFFYSTYGKRIEYKLKALTHSKLFISRSTSSLMELN